MDLDEKFPLGYEFKLIDKKEWSIREVCPKPSNPIAYFARENESKPEKKPKYQTKPLELTNYAKAGGIDGVYTLSPSQTPMPPGGGVHA